MKIKTGIDFLNLERFLKSLESGGQGFRERVFTPQELRQNSNEQLASVFVLKEALLKALELPPGLWQKISTSRKENGKLSCTFLDPEIAKNIESLDTSISHDGGWILAAAVIILK